MTVFISGTSMKNSYVGTTRVNDIYVGTVKTYTRQVWTDVGMNMNSCAITLGSGATNPVSGGVANDWTLAFYFTWNSAKGGALMYHNYQQRESIIKLMDDGRIMVNANRYDTSNYKTWYSVTHACQVGRLNCVLVNRSGQIFINGNNATPATYGGDMPLWGEFKIFPDRDINGTIMGLQGWNWNLNSNYLYVSNPLTWPYQTDASNFAMNFDSNLSVRRNTLNTTGVKAQTGTPTYITRKCDSDRVFY